MADTNRNDWFSTQATYRGLGRAEFSTPRGWAEGPTEITFDDRGRQSIEMLVEKIECERQTKACGMEFFAGQEPVGGCEKVVYSFGASSNPCSKLTVRCPDGTFSAEGKILYNTQFSFGDGPFDRVTLRFHPLRSQFDEEPVTVPKFWVLPLYNFVSEFLYRHPDLDHHPLRILKAPPEIPGEAPANKIGDPKAHYIAHNRLIVFEFKGNLGFIEPLPEYDAQVAKLTNGDTTKSITAVMIGNVGSEKIDFDELESWFPFDVLGLLGLATGAVIGAPWIEFRNSEGRLVRRSHVELGTPVFVPGHGAIHEPLHRGTGRLVTRALASPNFRKGYIHAVVRHLILAGFYQVSTVEDELTHVARALDCACHELGLTGFNLLDELKEPSDRKLVKDEIKRAAERIKDVADAAIQEGELERGKTLKNIANKTLSQPPYIVNNFGAAVLSLLKQAQLEDSYVVERYYAEHPRADGKGWQELLSNLRGRVIHRSYFDFDKEHDIWEVWKITRHLHDILTRVVLKALDYDGTYHPIVSEWVTDVPLNWVNKDTPPARLGYG